jgi:hypothetical protein
MLAGMPISISLGLTVFTGIERSEIMAVPFFILAGNFLTHGGVARRMIDFATPSSGTGMAGWRWLGSPTAEPAQPRALIGGHLISTLVGLFVVKLCGPGPWVAAMAVGLAIAAMHMTDTFHPPAGIDPLIVVVNDMSWSFLVVPVGIGVVLLALFAFVWHNLVARGANKADIWPTRWW